jgi:hypothetical protein
VKLFRVYHGVFNCAVLKNFIDLPYGSEDLKGKSAFSYYSGFIVAAWLLVLNKFIK